MYDKLELSRLQWFISRSRSPQKGNVCDLGDCRGRPVFFHATTWSTCFMWLGTYRERCMQILFVMRWNIMRNKENHGCFYLGRRYETLRLEILTPLWRISKSFLREEQRVCSVNAKLAGRTFSCRAPDWRKERFFSTLFSAPGEERKWCGNADCKVQHLIKNTFGVPKPLISIQWFYDIYDT